MAGANPLARSSVPLDAQAAAVREGLSKKPRTLWGDAWRRFRKHKLAIAGSMVLIFFILAALLGPIVWRIDPETIDFAESMSSSSLRHPMGTDDLGRDIL